MHKMAFAHVFGPEKKNGFGPFSYKFFVCIRVGLICLFLLGLKTKILDREKYHTQTYVKRWDNSYTHKQTSLEQSNNVNSTYHYCRDKNILL